MEAIKDVNFSGELDYNRLNGYMFLRVDKNFASKCSLLLLNEDFTSRYWPGKSTMCNGKEYTYISIFNSLS